MLSKNKIREIILHVGLHKTGTSSIQQTLFKNIKFLRKKGLIYPESWNPNHSFIFAGNFVDEFVKLKQKIDKKENSDKLIISGEDISAFQIDRLKGFKNFLSSLFTNNIRVIIYVREPLSWAISAIQERIKQQDSYQDGFKHVKDILNNLFENRVGNFINLFGENNVTIISFEEAIKHKYGLVGQFLSLVGLNDDDISSKIDIFKSNESISLRSADIISFINHKFPLFVDGKINHGRFRGDIEPLLEIRGPKFDIQHKDKVELHEINQKDVLWLKENCGINYTKNYIPKTEIKYEFTDEIISDIRTVYYELPTTLKGLLLEYLNYKMSRHHSLFNLQNLQDG